MPKIIERFTRHLRYNYFLFATVPLLSALSLWLAYQLRFDFDVPPDWSEQLLMVLPFVVLVKLGLFYLLDVHATDWRYVGLRDFATVNLYAAAAAVVLFSMRWIDVVLWIPRGVLLMDTILTMVLTGGMRISARLVREKLLPMLANGNGRSRRSAVIVGAGDAGELILREINRNPKSTYLVRALFDDDPSKAGTTVHGVRVEGPVDGLPSYTAQNPLDTVLIAIPSANRSQMKRINDIARGLKVQVKTLPSILEMMDTSRVLTQLRDIDITDILGREEINADSIRLEGLIAGKVVLVTGAGGSIGSEICRQVLKSGPEKIIMMDKTENSLFHAHRKLLALDPSRFGEVLAPVLCDVRDSGRILHEMERYRPHLVLHAAAHKHVGMQERNPLECFMNNVGGMTAVVKAADDVGVERFVLISTDKAVNPTSVMGATKRVCETYCLAYADRSSTKLMVVRFGNVLASEGSVVPIFLDQIAAGGPVTVTHPEVRRYFMTIPEAISLVLHAAALGESGQLLMLDMGDPVRILDLARHLINLASKTEDQIPIEFTGLRPGEKLFEELGSGDGACVETAHRRIKACTNPLGRRNDIIDKVDKALQNHLLVLGRLDVRAVLKELVPEYQPAWPSPQHESGNEQPRKNGGNKGPRIAVV